MEKIDKIIKCTLTALPVPCTVFFNGSLKNPIEQVFFLLLVSFELFSGNDMIISLRVLADER